MDTFLLFFIRINLWEAGSWPEKYEALLLVTDTAQDIYYRQAKLLQ